MKSEKNQKEKKHEAGTGYRILGAVYIVAAVAFLISVFMVGILPVAYFAGVAVLIAVISIPVLKGLFSRKSSKSKGKDGETSGKSGGRTLASIVAVLMILLCGAGTYYMASTMNFFGKISDDVQTHDFYVVVRDDSSFERLKDIDGKTVDIMNDSSKAYAEAQELLAEKVDVKFRESGGFDQVAKALIDGKTDVIFINSGFYDMAVDEVEGFTRDNTRILYHIKVDVEASGNSKKINVTEDPFSVYVSGIDTRGSIGNISRTDVNMVMTVNPKTKTILLTSIPRDYYVKFASYGEMDKLTHSGLYGIDETVATVENLLETEINYNLKVNFTTVEKLVDELGGITVNSDYSFSAGGFNYVEGENFLDGAQALAFARERYSFSSGDNQRVKNQQAVISGIIDKCTSSTSILTNYTGILSSVKDNMQTSMSQKEIKSLVKMQLADMDGWTIRKQSLTGSGLMTPVYSMPNSSVYVMVPDQASVDSAKEQIAEIMGR